MNMKTTPHKFNELAPDVEVQIMTGETIHLSSLWTGKTLVWGTERRPE